MTPPPALPGRHVRECACGRGLQCVGMTQAFRLLGDPRCHYVELPRYRKDPPAYKYVFRNKLREAYLKHLGISNTDLDIEEFEAPKRRYVALHHFHPTVVRAFYENPLSLAQKHKVPISITEHEMKELDMSYDEDDRITSMTGKPTGGYYFVPNYTQEKVHADLKTLIVAERSAKEYAKTLQKAARKRMEEKSKIQSPVPKDIDIVKRDPKPYDIATKDHDDDGIVKEEVKAIPISIPTSISTSESNKNREMDLMLVDSGEQSFDALWDEPELQKPARQDSPSKLKKTRDTQTEPAPEKEVDLEKEEDVEKDPEPELITEPAMVTSIEEKEQSEKVEQSEAVAEPEKEEEAKTEEQPERIEASEQTPAQAMSEKTPEDNDTTRTVVVPIGQEVKSHEKITASPQTLQRIADEGSQVADFSAPLKDRERSRNSGPVDLDDSIDQSFFDEEDDIAGETAEAPDKERMVPNLIWEETGPVDIGHSFDDDEEGSSAKPSARANKELSKDASNSARVEAPDEEAVIPNYVLEKPGLVDLDQSFDDEEVDNSTELSPSTNEETSKDVSCEETVKSPAKEVVVPNHVQLSEKPGLVNLDRVIDDEEEDSPAKVEASEEEVVVTNQKLGPVDLGHVIDDEEEDTPAALRSSVNGEPSSEASSLAKAEVAQDDVVPLNDEEDEFEIDTSIIESETAFTPYSTRQTPAGMKVIDESDESDVDDNISQGSTGHMSASADADRAGSVDSPSKRPSYFSKARVEFADAKADADRAESVDDLAGRRPSYFAKVREEFGEAKEKEPEPLVEVERPPSPTFADEGIAFSLNHQLPGSDPTLRIQVHNDLIAWESKRRSKNLVHMELNREKWSAARDVIRDGVDEVQVAERLVFGFAKAGRMFAGALQAMYEDKNFDSQGQTVTNSFVQKRLMSQRQKMEHSVDNTSKGLHDGGQGGQSSLLTSIIEAQLVLASSFNDNSQHMEDEIFSEIMELREETLGRATELETLGESILAEMKRSETELKKIWDVFDAMVTGDLMEYSMHGSMHGSMQSGSQHGGSFHFGGGSVHGLSTQRGEESPIISSVNSPLVKSTFEQLGGVEDGWLIETYYRAGVAYQKSVFETGERVLETVYQDIVLLEERRRDRLHQVMLAFIPRQRRLFLGLPAHLKDMLDKLVGLRIDEDSLQSLIDDSIKDRSRDHLKSQYQHKSSIMNRSRIQTSAADSNEVQNIEREFGNPFASSMILLSHVLELQPGGLRGIVNKEWKVTLAVVTAEGNFHLFYVPAATIGANLTPSEAFKKLYPAMEFGTPETWMKGRKEQIVKNLTPYMTLNLSKCSISISKMRQRQFEVVEEREKGSGNRFLHANSQRQKKCTLRLPSAKETTDWVSVLEKTKKQVSQESPSVFKV